MNILSPRSRFAAFRRGFLSVWVATGFAVAAAVAAEPYFPPRDGWARRLPAELGLDPAKLAEAVAYAQDHETPWPRDFSEQEKIFGQLLGSIPTWRARTNGLVIFKGYVVAEFGETTAADPTYSAAKSMLATVAGIAVRDGLIADLDQPVGATVTDGGYASAQNAKVTWRMHLRQDSNGKARCGARRTISSVRPNLGRLSASRGRCRRRVRTTNTTTFASIASRFRCCGVSVGRCRRYSATR